MSHSGAGARDVTALPTIGNDSFPILPLDGRKFDVNRHLVDFQNLI